MKIEFTGAYLLRTYFSGVFKMITKEVREWIQKVERRQYSYDDAMYELMRFSSFLTREELKLIKNKLEESYKN